jgi:hypothetical protein
MHGRAKAHRGPPSAIEDQRTEDESHAIAGSVIGHCFLQEPVAPAKKLRQLVGPQGLFPDEADSADGRFAMMWGLSCASRPIASRSSQTESISPSAHDQHVSGQPRSLERFFDPIAKSFDAKQRRQDLQFAIPHPTRCFPQRTDPTQTIQSTIGHRRLSESLCAYLIRLSGARPKS